MILHFPSRSRSPPLQLTAPLPPLRTRIHSSPQMLYLRIRILHINTDLRQQQLIQRTPIPQIQPFPTPRALLRILPLARQDEVVALGSGDGRGEPDLFVGWLLVQDVGAGGGEC
jgi:hypothetical protein